MWKPLERPLTLGCYFVVLFLTVAAWGWECERLDRQLEPATIPAVLLSGESESGSQCVIGGSERGSSSQSFHLDNFNDDEGEDDSEFWFFAGQTRELPQPQTRELGQSDADHTTLARGRWARIPILRY